MNTGTMRFSVPHGDTPDAYRQTFQRLGINYPEKTGQGGSTGLLVTKTMVVVGDLQPTTGPGRTSPAALLRAYDKQPGKEIGAIPMPGRPSGTPMTYMIDGRQYINIAIGGIGTAAGTYVTYALPMSEIRPAAAQ
jgi:quinoprotein glucose dehydrogenase